MAEEPKRADDFIMNPQTGPKLGGINPSSTKKKRIILAAAGGVFLLLIFGIVFSFLTGGGKATTEQTQKLAQQHIELLRVSDIGLSQSNDYDTRNLATTVKLTLQSTQDQVVAIAKKDQKKLTSAQLSAGKDTKTDETLTTAQQTNKFNAVFIEIIHTQIRAYLQQLRVVHDASSSKQDKQTLDDIYRQLHKLLPESTQPNSGT